MKKILRPIYKVKGLSNGDLLFVFRRMFQYILIEANSKWCIFLFRKKFWNFKGCTSKFSIAIIIGSSIYVDWQQSGLCEVLNRGWIQSVVQGEEKRYRFLFFKDMELFPPPIESKIREIEWQLQSRKY